MFTPAGIGAACAARPRLCPAKARRSLRRWLLGQTSDAPRRLARRQGRHRRGGERSAPFAAATAVGRRAHAPRAFKRQAYLSSVGLFCGGGGGGVAPFGCGLTTRTTRELAGRAGSTGTTDTGRG